MLGIFSLASCDPATDANSGLAKPVLFVLNEGGFQKSNASLDAIELGTGNRVQNLIPNLGDTGSDLERIGDKLYVVMSGSRQLYAASIGDGKKASEFQFDTTITPTSIAAISATEALITDRYRPMLILFDLKSNSIKSEIPMPQGTVDLAVVGNKAYISASSNYLYVLDIATHTVIDTVEVGLIPEQVIYDAARDQILVVAQGAWGTGEPRLTMIDVTTHVVKNFLTGSVGEMLSRVLVAGDQAYAVFSNRVARIDLTTSSTTNPALITKGFYGGTYDPTANELYLAATSWNAEDPIEVYDASTGTLKRTLQGGIAPARFAFYR